jgi:predicted AAA+ superfamily ATPase
LFEPPKGSYFFFGPRGTGKSTLLARLYPYARSIDLLDEGRYQSLLRQPEAFAAELEALKDRTTVVVDEVQRLPDLLNTVHRMIEAKRLRFVLCGSSARKLRRSGVNLLAGRATRRRCPRACCRSCTPRRIATKPFRRTFASI